MNDFFNFYTLLTLLACLIAGLFFAWLFYRNTAHLDKKIRYGLAIARTIVVAMIGVLLFFPLIRTVSYRPEKPIVIIGQDNSLSIGNVTSRGFNRMQYEKEMQSLSSQLADQYEVKIYNFSDSIKPGFDFSDKGKMTNIVQLFTKLNDEYQNRNVGAVIIASDGIFNRGGSPLYHTDKLKAPVYTIALGDTIPKKDLLIANISHNSLVYFDNEFTIELQVEAFEAKGNQSTVTVFENGKKLYEDKLLITSDVFVKHIPIKLKASKLGLQKYTVALSLLDNEVSEKNNVQDIFTEVIDAKQKVLIAAGAPHPDITALRQAIIGYKNFEVKVGLAEELNTLNVNDYGLVVLYQLPSAIFDAGSFIRKVQSTNVPIWYILGAQSNINAFNQVQQLVNLNGGNNSTLQETYSVVKPGFTAFELDPLMVKQINAFDPLQAPLGKAIIKGSNTVVLNQRIGKVSTDYPQLFFIADNERKTGFLIGEGIWKWKLSEAEGTKDSTTVFSNLISKTIQYLSIKDDKRKFKVYPAKNTFDENENILLNAVLYNDNYAAVNTPDVSISIKDEHEKTYKFLFSRTDAAYQLNAGSLPAGNYSYIATTALGDKKYLAQGVFYINAVVTEYQQTVANHQLLNTMAKQTGGKMVMPQDLLKLLDEIKKNEQIKTLSFEDRKYEELINFKWLFAMIIVLLTLEWFFRKRVGEI